jgi:uncharacterized protein
MEKFAEDAELLGQLREYLANTACCGQPSSKARKPKGAKFRDWFDFAEAGHQHALAPRAGPAARAQ